MIYNTEWRFEFYRQIMPALANAYKDLTAIAGHLRDDTGVEVWTETPTDSSKVASGKAAFSLEGWRVHFAQRYQQVGNYISSYGTLLNSYDSQAKIACDGLISSLPSLATTMNSIIAAHTTGGILAQEKITQTERNTLATAIEGQLQ